MADAASFTLQLMRGDDYRKRWGLVDAETGASIIGAGQHLHMSIKAAAGASPDLLDIGEIGPPGTTLGITNIDYSTGEFDVVIPAANLTSLPGAAMEVTRYAWRLWLTDTDGLNTTYGFGPVELQPAA